MRKAKRLCSRGNLLVALSLDLSHHLRQQPSPHSPPLISPTLSTIIIKKERVMSLPSKPKPISKSSGTPLHFYVLPRDVAIRIFTLLPLSSLLTCQRINKRFRTLITRSEKFRPHLFLEPPAPATPKTNVSTSLHPVFGRLNFFAYHSAKAIRIGEGLNGIFLMKCPVREQFATSPALGEVVIRVISGGEWPFDAEIAVTNERGVTVWDVVRGVTGLYVPISFHLISWIEPITNEL